MVTVLISDNAIWSTTSDSFDWTFFLITDISLGIAIIYRYMWVRKENKARYETVNNFGQITGASKPYAKYFINPIMYFGY